MGDLLWSIFVLHFFALLRCTGEGFVKINIMHVAMQGGHTHHKMLSESRTKIMGIIATPLKSGMKRFIDDQRPNKRTICWATNKRITPTCVSGGYTGEGGSQTKKNGEGTRGNAGTTPNCLQQHQQQHRGTYHLRPYLIPLLVRIYSH